uniref:Uncharacterized protein n=1 Tax=Acrobeloides nanus TaxID=290746 RepID=A0A914CGU4_9BILA
MFIRYFRLNSLKSIQQRLVHFEKNQTNIMEKQGTNSPEMAQKLAEADREAPYKAIEGHSDITRSL